MSEPLHGRRPEELNAVERLALAMGRPVPPRPTKQEWRAFQVKLRRAEKEARRAHRRSPAKAEPSKMDPVDDGLNVVERLARAMGRPVPAPPSEEEWREFQARLTAAEDDVRQRFDERGGAAA